MNGLLRLGVPHPGRRHQRRRGHSNSSSQTQPPLNKVNQINTQRAISLRQNHNQSHLTQYRIEQHNNEHLNKFKQKISPSQKLEAQIYKFLKSFSKLRIYLTLEPRNEKIF